MTQPQATASRLPGNPLARISPKHLIAGFITLILLVGEVRYGVLGGFERLVASLGAAVLAEVLFARLLLGRWPPTLLSAYITGNSVALLVKPQEGLLWPFVMCSVLSIASKYALRFRGRHLWNPSNFGIAALLLLAAPKVAILSHELGNAWITNAVIWSLGLLIVQRAKLLHVSVTYALAFGVLAAVRSLTTGGTLSTELAPITGPMYQLFVFFMVTDPATTLPTRGGRIAVAIAIALVEAALRSANDMGLPWVAVFAPAPAFFALATVGPLALVLQRWLRPVAPRRPARPAVQPAPAG